MPDAGSTGRTLTAVVHTALPVLWIAAIVAAEILGRRSPSDVWDAIGVFVFGALVAVTIPRVTRCELGGTARLRRGVRRLGRRIVDWWPDMGIDLRGDPPLSRAFPNAMLTAALIVGLLAAGTLAARSAFPGPAREAIIGVSPTAYFLLVGTYWTALLGLFGLSALSTWRDMNDHIPTDNRASRRRASARLAVAIAWLGLIAALAFLVPIHVAWAVCGVAGALGFGAAHAIDRHERLRIIWRSAPDAEARTFDAGGGVRWDAFVMACLIPLLTVPGTGVGRGGALAEAVPITLGLATAASWAGAIAFLSYTMHGPVRAYLLARHDPAKREPVPLLVDDAARLPAETVERLSAHGFRCVNNGGPEGPGPAVRVEVSDGAPSRGLQRLDREAGFLAFAPRVRVDSAALASSSTLAELRQLDHALLRDRFAVGLRGILSVGARRRYHHGTGFWIAPHLWYVRGLTRDSDDPDYHSIGTPYHKALPRRVRQHVHRVLQATEIDLVFAEDAVPLDAVESVFERLFDVYDVLGPERVDDVAFVGLQRVRVMLHDFTLGEPFRRPGYREPSYDEIGRARILHVMLDRGDGDDELDPAPEVPEEKPSFVGL